MNGIRAAVFLTLLGAGAAEHALAQQNVLSVGASNARRCMEAAFAGSTARAAVEWCNQALSQEPLRPADRAGTLVNRGVLLMNRREYTAAEADFEAAVALRPESGDALFNRGTVRVAQGRAREGVEDISRSLELGLREREKGFYNRAVAREALSDLAGARLDYLEAARLKPDWPLPRRELARFSVARR